MSFKFSLFFLGHILVGTFTKYVCGVRTYIHSLFGYVRKFTQYSVLQSRPKPKKSMYVAENFTPYKPAN
jgi:hypothetical protein